MSWLDRWLAKRNSRPEPITQAQLRLVFPPTMGGWMIDTVINAVPPPPPPPPGGNVNPVIVKTTTTEVAIVNSAAETTIWTFTLNANILAAGNILEFRLWGDNANGGGVTTGMFTTYKIKVGATVISTVTPSVCFRNATSSPLSHLCISIIKAITDATQRATMVQWNPWLQTFAWGSVINTGDNTSSINFASAQTITITATCDAAQVDHTFTFRSGECVQYPAT